MDKPKKPRRNGPRTLLALLLVLLALIGGYWGWRELGPGAPTREARSGQNGGQPRPSAVPVAVAEVKTADVPVYLYGLGTVQAYNTVTVRSRVDGQVEKIAFEEGQSVHEGDLLAQVDPRPFKAALDQANAKKALDEASLANAKLDLNRYATLGKQDFSSRQQVDTQRSLVNQLTAQIEADEAQIESAQTQLDYATIRSPLTGRAGFRQIDAGNIVHASDQTGIVSIDQLQPISVMFTAPEGELPRITQALASGPLPVTALSSDGQTELGQGRLELLDNQIDAASGTIRLKAMFDNQENTLWPGLSVSTKLLVDTLKAVAVVPEDAVERGPDGLFAFVVGDDNKADIHKITVSHTDGRQAVVEQGLSPGERVVTQGQYRVEPGTLVAAKESEPVRTA